MNAKKFFIFLSLIVALSLVVGTALAEDGIMFRRNVSKTPDAETEKAGIYMMDFYAPAQSANGTVLDGTVEGEDGIVYTLIDGSISEDYPARYFAKPLVSVYIDDIGGEGESIGYNEESSIQAVTGGITFGHFDAFAAYSLDDGTSFRTENLSRSQDLSSFTLKTGEAYPGDVHNVQVQVAEDKILVVWASKYCQSGFPLYSFSTVDNIADYQAYLADLEDVYGKNALYLYDFFGVAGGQGSVDYELQGYPEIGEIPFSCIWTARGKLLAGDDPMTADVVEASHVVWMAPERLTSGVRDANLPAVDCAKGAGCVLTWQEDPEGLRPGKGLGPGEGWSGAIANAKTDIWYSYINFNDFDLVVDDLDTDGFPDAGEALLIDDYELKLLTEMDRPKPYVPMAMPVRITDNDMCKATASQSAASDGYEDPFCWTDFDTIDDLNNTNIVSFFDNLTGPETGADFCNTSEAWTNPGGTTLEICVTEDGRWMLGRVASTRVRMVLKPYFPDGAATDLDLDSFPDDGSAWISFAAEETKALGLTADTDGDGDTSDETVDPIDIGKDMFYYSFDFAKPYNLSTNTAIVETKPYIVQQGGMINQPAMCSPWFITTDQTNPGIVCDDSNAYEFFDVQVDPITGYEYYLTEIARRFAMTLNNIGNITNKTINESGLAGMLIYKQGIIWQGGPADIMLRRMIVPDDFDPTVDNPFAFENMDCTNPDGTSGWVYPTDVTGSFSVNPYYLKGLCMAPAINITGSTIVSCDGGEDNDTCASLFPVADDGTIPDNTTEDKFPKVREWRQLPNAGTASSDMEIGTVTDDDLSDLDDQTWENPYDVSKGHRGFVYGDMVMMMYAWSPNWQSNRVGNDHYNLYQRRSFDGGLTWKTPDSNDCTKFMPAESIGTALCDGTDYIEYYYSDATIGDYTPVVWSYGPGVDEQGRNLSLLTGNQVTILDPRYSPPGGLKQYSSISPAWLTAHEITYGVDELPYFDDAAIDPSKYYMVYETGDNTTVAVGEAIPLDLFYSRATNFGDDYEFYDYLNDAEDCNPELGVAIDWTACLEPRWPWLENATDDLSGEASVILNPGGTFAYNVWNQWQEEVGEDGHEHVFDADMIFRRTLWLPDGSDALLEPTAAFLYTGPVVYSIEDTVTLVVSARDLDKVGAGANIVEYNWTIQVSDEEPIDLTKFAGCLKEEPMCQVPVNILMGAWSGYGNIGNPGAWSASVKVVDNDGQSATIYAPEFYTWLTINRINLPFVVR